MPGSVELPVHTAPEDDVPLGDLDAAFSDVAGEAAIVPENTKPAETPVVEPAAVEPEPVAEVKEEVKETPTPREELEAIPEETVDPLAVITESLAPEDKPAVTPSSREDVLKDLGVAVDKLPIFKQMSNDAFNYNVELLKDHKEAVAKREEIQTQLEESAKSDMPNSYFDHPEAFTLNPEYRKANAEVSHLDRARQHYAQQHVKIRAGEKWQDIAGTNQDGSYQLVEKEADAQSEVTVMQNLNELQTFTNQRRQEIQGMEARFAQARAGRQSVFSEYENAFFPQYKDSADNKHIKAINQVLAQKQVADNPMAGLFSKLYAHAMETQGKVNALTAENSTLKQNQKPATENPTDADINTGVTEDGRQAAAEDNIGDIEKQFDALLEG